MLLLQEEIYLEQRTQLTKHSPKIVRQICSSITKSCYGYEPRERETSQACLLHVTRLEASSPRRRKEKNVSNQFCCLNGKDRWFRHSEKNNINSSQQYQRKIC